MTDIQTLASGSACALGCAGGKLVLSAHSAAGEDVLAEVAGLHERALCARLPMVISRTSAILEFDLAPLGTVAQLIAHSSETNAKLSYASALGLSEMTAEVYAAIRAEYPEMASGFLSAGQIVFDLEGGLHFVGLATNLRLGRDEAGRASPYVGVAPEVARGGTASRGSDTYAAAQLGTSIAPYLQFPPELGEALNGKGAQALTEAAHYFDSRVLTHVVPARELELSSVVARFRDTWATLGLNWSVDGAAAELAALALERLGPRLQTLEVAGDGSHFRRALNAQVSLASRTAPRRLLTALAEDHRNRGPGLSFDAMIAAGWPAERILPGAARARVHMAVSTLRKLGLGNWLEHEGGRYRLSRAVRLAVG